jgi:antitoxin HicB
MGRVGGEAHTTRRQDSFDTHAQPGGDYPVTSPTLPELITDGEMVDEALANVNDALAAVRELYEDLSKPLPTEFAPTSPLGASWMPNSSKSCGRSLLSIMKRPNIAPSKDGTT